MLNRMLSANCANTNLECAIYTDHAGALLACRAQGALHGMHPHGNAPRRSRGDSTPLDASVLGLVAHNFAAACQAHERCQTPPTPTYAPDTQPTALSAQNYPTCDIFKTGPGDMFGMLLGVV